jgi:co-chaperonin GroES (HSP10)
MHRIRGFEIMLRRSDVLRAAALGVGLAISAGVCLVTNCGAQTPAATASAAGRQIGTVKSVTGNSLTLATDAGQQISVSVAEQARILQLAPGSTSLKDAQTIALTAIEAGDRVLVTGKAGGDPNSFEASRIILMKSSDIAQKHASEEADWQKRGMGGIVSAVDAGTGTLTIAEGAKKITVNTSNKTEFRRYASDSVKYQDAKPGSFAQIHAGDQLRVRGEKSADGTSITAEEVISGTFKHLSGLIATIDQGNETLTLKDLATKKMVTVKVMANSSVRALPPGDAARFAARAKSRGAGGESHGASGHSGQAGGEGGAAETRSAGMDLSQLVSRLPNQTLADLKAGDAVMIVASQSDPGSSSETAVTVLSGVEPILAATPSGAEGMTLSPWNIGGGAGDAGAQ